MKPFFEIWIKLCPVNQFNWTVILELPESSAESAINDYNGHFMAAKNSISRQFFKFSFCVTKSTDALNVSEKCIKYFLFDR